MELRTVNGKKQYGYLKKPLKDMLDFIVDELEKMPEVATYYSIWNDLFYPQLGVKLCSMAGGGVQKSIWCF